MDGSRQNNTRQGHVAFTPLLEQTLRGAYVNDLRILPCVDHLLPATNNPSRGKQDAPAENHDASSETPNICLLHSFSIIMVHHLPQSLSQQLVLTPGGVDVLEALSSTLQVFLCGCSPSDECSFGLPNLPCSKDPVVWDCVG